MYLVHIIEDEKECSDIQKEREREKERLLLSENFLKLLLHSMYNKERTH